MSEYSIRILSERAAEVKEDLARLVAEEDQLAEEHQRLREKLAELQQRRGKANTKTMELRGELVDLQNDIARLQETAPNGAPDPGPVPERRERTPLPELDRGIAERHEVNAPPGRRRDPLHVTPQQHPAPVGAAPGSKRPRKYHAVEPVDLDKVTTTWWDRAELAYELLQEHGGPMSQKEWGEAFAGLLDAKLTTGQSALSRCIGILQTVKRVLWTGEHEAGSAIWVTHEHASAELRAAAGLGTGEENFAGKTTRWPTPSTSPPKGTLIEVEQGSYEGGKKR